MNPDADPAHDLAQSQLGLNERQNAAAIKDYLETGGQNLDPQQLAWCAAFVNSTLSQSGLQGSGSPAARSLLDVGKPIQYGDNILDQPRQGDLAVFSRQDPKNPNAGHVGFYTGESPGGDISLLGGNQGKKGEVSIKPYPQERLLGFRRPEPSEPRDQLAMLRAPKRKAL